MKPPTRKHGIAACYFLSTLLFLIGLPTEIPAGTPGGSLDELVNLDLSEIRSMMEEMITGVMDFSEAENEVFLPLYEKYEAENNELFDRRLALIQEYKAVRNTLDEKKSTELAERTFELDRHKVQLYERYYAEFSRVLTAKRAAQLFQLLRRVDLLMNLKIAAIVPIIGEDW